VNVINWFGLVPLLIFLKHINRDSHYMVTYITDKPVPLDHNQLTNFASNLLAESFSAAFNDSNIGQEP
jgi:hypothetical protein